MYVAFHGMLKCKYDGEMFYREEEEVSTCDKPFCSTCTHGSIKIRFYTVNARCTFGWKILFIACSAAPFDCEMGKLKKFILENFKGIKQQNNPVYRPGIMRTDLLEELNRDNVDFIRHLFILYKCSVENEKYKNLIIENIGKVENLLERANVLIELNMLNAAEECLEKYKRMIGISLDVIGAEAVFKKHNCIENVTYVLDVTYRNGCRQRGGDDMVEACGGNVEAVGDERSKEEVQDRTGVEDAGLDQKNEENGMRSSVIVHQETIISSTMERNGTRKTEENGKAVLMTDKKIMNMHSDVVHEHGMNGASGCESEHQKVEHPVNTGKSHMKSYEERKLYKFETRDHVFKNYRVFSLCVNEQYLLLTIIRLLLKSQGPEHLEYARAYLDRLLFNRNGDHDMKDYMLGHYKNVLYDETNEPCFVRSFCFEAPLIFSFEYAQVLGNNLFKKYFFESALEIFTCLGRHEKMAKCYLGMGKEQEMIKELRGMKEKMEIKVFGKRMNVCDAETMKESTVQTDDTSANEQIIPTSSVTRNVADSPAAEPDRCMKSSATDVFDLVNTYNLLAELTNNTYYYTLSYRAYKTYTPLKLEAVHRLRNKEYEKALSLLKQALDHSPYNITLLHMVGCLETAIHGNGVSYFLRILSIDSNNYETLINVGNFYTEKEKYEESVYFYTRAYKINKSARLLKQLGAILEVTGKYDEIKCMLRREDRKNVLFARDKELIAMFDRYSK